MTSRSRRAAVTLGLVLCATTLTACNDDDHGGSDVTSVTGSCALDATQYDDLSPLSSDQLEAMLGEGDYRLEGSVRPGANGVPEGGSCIYSRRDDSGALLELGVNRKTDLFRTYDEARALEKTDQAHAIDGLDGFIVADPGTGSDGSRGPLAVVFGPDHQVVTMHVLVPSKDAPGDDTIATAAKAAAESLGSPMRRS
jgi:predicted small secreted protein